MRLRTSDSPVGRRTATGAAIAVGIALALFPSLTGADLYLSADRSGILPVNATVISFLSLSSAFGLIVLFGLARDRGRGICSTYLAAAPVLFAFLLLTMVQLGGGSLPAAHWSGSGKFIYLPLYGLGLLVFSVGIASTLTFRQYYRVIFAVCLLSAAGSIFIDVFYPQTFSKLYSRPAGFMKNPNAGAATVLVLTIATVDWTRSRASDMLVWLIAGMAVVATLSRGGLVLLAVAFLLYSIVAARSERRAYAKHLAMLLVAVAMVVLLYSMASPGSAVYSTDNQRLERFKAFLSGESSAVVDDPRVGLVFDYIGLVSERPILGHGTGYVESRVVGSHNTFLSLWVENGVLGLSAYLMLLLVCLWYFRQLSDPRGQVFCVCVVVLSFLRNDVLVLRPVIVVLGIFSTLAVLERFSGSLSARPIARRRLAKPHMRAPNRGRSPGNSARLASRLVTGASP